MSRLSLAFNVFSLKNVFVSWIAAGGFAREQDNGIWVFSIRQHFLQFKHSCRYGVCIFRKVVSYDRYGLDLLYFAILWVGPDAAASCPHNIWDFNAPFIRITFCR